MERDTEGRFAEGNSLAKGTTSGPNSGRPTDATKLELAKRLYLLCEDEWDDVILALLAKAREGNVNATKLLFAYVLGTPEQAILLQGGDNYARLLVALRRADEESTTTDAA